MSFPYLRHNIPYYPIYIYYSTSHLFFQWYIYLSISVVHAMVESSTFWCLYHWQSDRSTYQSSAWCFNDQFTHSSTLKVHDGLCLYVHVCWTVLLYFDFLILLTLIIGCCNHEIGHMLKILQWEKESACLNELFESSVRTIVPRLRLIDRVAFVKLYMVLRAGSQIRQFKVTHWCSPCQKLKHYHGRRRYALVTERQLHELKDRSLLLWECRHLI